MHHPITIAANMAVAVRVVPRRAGATAQPLSPAAFAPFGSVIANPRPDVHPAAFAAHAASLPDNAVTANQGSAIQYRNVSRVRDVYAEAPSARPGEAVVSLFVCAARPLRRAADDDVFDVAVLERHPFTTQTFSPLASSASAYLVVVAPSLPPADGDRHLPVPRDPDLPGRGLPDLSRLAAFVATSAQAVTYGAGTWHAPMVVLGEPGTTLDFVVTQSVSGVPLEDCQLIEFDSAGAGEPRVEVRIPRGRRERL